MHRNSHANSRLISPVLSRYGVQMVRSRSLGQQKIFDEGTCRLLRPHEVDTDSGTAPSLHRE